MSPEAVLYIAFVAINHIASMTAGVVFEEEVEDNVPVIQLVPKG